MSDRSRVVLLALAFSALLAAPASALRTNWYVPREVRFSAFGCNDPSRVTMHLERGAFAVYARRPRPGFPLRDIDTGELVARITGISINPNRRHPSITWTARGRGAVCADPGAHQFGWRTDVVALRGEYVTSERVFSPGCGRFAYRPRSFVVACGDGNFGFTGLHWSAWRDHVALGYGTSYGNDCIPYCAAGHFHYRAVRLRLFRTRFCAAHNRWMFTRVSWRWRDSGDGGTESIGYGCNY